MNECVSHLRCLLKTLGVNSQEYLDIMKLWFKMAITKEEFDKRTKTFMSSEQIELHNQMILSILRNCAGIAPKTTPVTETFLKPFEPLNSLYYEDLKRNPIEDDQRSFVMHERVLPDRALVMSRLYHNAWETGLQGSTTASADLIVIATQKFLKNVLTAVISRRKGFRLSNSKFIHSLDSPIANPWLRNVAKHTPETNQRYRYEMSKDDILFSVDRLSSEKIEQEMAFSLASSAPNKPLLPISLIDIFMTLTIYPSIIASDFLYTITRERIITKIEHPTHDD